MDAQAISNSYMVTNRAYPWEGWSTYIYPLPLWDNFYFLAPGANNPNWQQYKNGPNSTGPMPSSYQSALEADIASAVQSGGRQVTVFIHGLSYVLSDACERLGTYGRNLASQGYKGLLIGFSWPSYGSVDSYLYYGSRPYSFPPKPPGYGTIRDNIQGSTKSLLNLLSQLVPLCKKHGAQLNLMCHSEGNYMLMLAMYALSRNSDPALSELAAAGRFVDQVLMVAADINNGALEAPQGSPPLEGSGLVHRPVFENGHGLLVQRGRQAFILGRHGKNGTIRRSRCAWAAWPAQRRERRDCPERLRARLLACGQRKQPL